MNGRALYSKIFSTAFAIFHNAYIRSIYDGYNRAFWLGRRCHTKSVKVTIVGSRLHYSTNDPPQSRRRTSSLSAIPFTAAEPRSYSIRSFNGDGTGVGVVGGGVESDVDRCAMELSFIHSHFPKNV